MNFFFQSALAVGSIFYINKWVVSCSAKHLTWIGPLHSSLARGYIILCKCASMNQWTNVRKPVIMQQILSRKLMALTLQQGEWCFQEIILTENVSPFSSDFPPGLACFFLFLIALDHLFCLAFGLCNKFLLMKLPSYACANSILSIFFGNISVFWNLEAQKSNPRIAK